jgi:hypothetical protein
MRHVILSCGHLLHDRVALDARMLGQQNERTSTGGATLPQPVLVKLVQMNRSRHSDTSESWTREEDALLLSKRLGLIIEGRDADVKALDNGVMPISGIEDKTAVDRIKRLRRIFTQESVDLMRSAGLESSTDRNASSPAAAAAATAARSAAATATAAAKPHEDLAAAARSAAATRSAKAAAAARAAPYPWMLSSSTTDAPLSPLVLSYDAPVSLDVPHGSIPFGTQINYAAHTAIIPASWRLQIGKFALGNGVHVAECSGSDDGECGCRVELPVNRRGREATPAEKV